MLEKNHVCKKKYAKFISVYAGFTPVLIRSSGIEYEGEYEMEFFYMEISRCLFS